MARRLHSRSGMTPGVAPLPRTMKNRCAAFPAKGDVWRVLINKVTLTYYVRKVVSVDEVGEELLVRYRDCRKQFYRETKVSVRDEVIGEWLKWCEGAELVRVGEKRQGEWYA